MSVLQPGPHLAPDVLVDTESERQLLSALLVADCYEAIAGRVQAEDFLAARYRIPFRAIAKLAATKQHVAPLTVYWQLQQDGTLADLNAASPSWRGDPKEHLAWLTDLHNDCGSAEGVEFWADVVHQWAVKRRLISLYAQLSERVLDNKLPRELVEEAMQQLAALGNAEADARQPRTLAQVVGDDHEAFQRLLDDPRALAGYACGLRSLDLAIDGFELGRLIVFAARTGMGKTLFAERIATGLADGAAGVPVFYSSLEMSGEQLKRRLAWSLTGISREQLRQQGIATADDRQLFAWAERELSRLPLVLDDRSGRNWRTIQNRMEQAITRDGVRVVVLDHIDLVSQPKGRTQNRHAEIAEVMADLKALAQQERVVVIALSQVNRAGAAREQGVPTIADLRESGTKEEDADTVGILHRAAAGRMDLAATDPLWHELEVFVVKHRDGRTGRVRLWVDLPTQRVGEWQ